MYVPARRRRIVRSTVLVLAAGGLVLFAGPAALAQEVSVDPASGLSDGDTVTVTATGLEAIDGQQAAVTQCGNADSGGNPIPASAAQDQASFAANCFGAEAIGSPHLVLTSVSDGSLTADYPVATSGIGANGATCIPTADAELPCQIVVADVATQGQTLTATAPIDVGDGETARAVPEELPATGAAGTLFLTFAGAGLAGTGALALVTARLRRRS